MNKVFATPNINKVYKMFLVEVDDEDRERVIACKAINFEISQDYNYDDIQVNQLLDSARIFRASDTKVTIRADLTPMEDGVYFRIENFLEQDLAETEEDEYDVPNEWETYE